MGLVDRDGRWRLEDRRGRSLWPRTFHDDHGVTHAVLLSVDAGAARHEARPILVCTGHVARRSGVDVRNQALTCLWCIVWTPHMGYGEVGDV